MRRAVLFVSLLTIGLFPTISSGLTPDLGYVVPVPGPIARPFNAPANKYAAGNRGTEFSVESGDGVIASAEGRVVFAGRIGAESYVSIQHSDGIRTTYSYLRSVSVRSGSTVRQGQSIGRTSERFQWGARIKDAYVDPMLLVTGGVEVHLIDSDNEVSKPFSAPTSRMAVEALLTNVDPLSCTMRPPESYEQTRRIAVLIGGLGSSSGGTSLFRLDFNKLGYEEQDIHQFSYLGGDAKENKYSTVDTFGDIAVAGTKAEAFLNTIHAQNPGIPIDIYSHSQGGLVARYAVTNPNFALKDINLVTIDSPHNGAELAGLNDKQLASRLRFLIDSVTDVDPHATAVDQLKPGSHFLNELRKRKLPKDIRALSIAASKDPVVPLPDAFWSDAKNIVAPSGGGNPHSTVVGTTELATELHLFINGINPTCSTIRRTIQGWLLGSTIEALETRLNGL